MENTVADVFKKTVNKLGSHTAVVYKKDNSWIKHTWQQHWDEVSRVAGGLIALGLQHGDAVTILSQNRREWVVADLAAILAGGVPAGIYPSSSPDQCQFIIGHCRSPFIFVEDCAQLDKVYPLLGVLPSLKGFILISGKDPRNKVWSWDELQKQSGPAWQEELSERIKNQKAGDLATLVYTSGTTSRPKAVMLNHTNLVWTADQAVAGQLDVSPDDVFISYLPLSHIAEQMTTIHGSLRGGYQVWFAESIDKLAENLREIRPTVFLGVPRVWEKIQAKMMEKAAQNSSLKRKIAKWAKKVGLDHARKGQFGSVSSLKFSLANKLVFSKVREALGLDRCRLAATAAAPISMGTLEFFYSLNIPVLEIFGMSETTGPATLSEPDAGYRIGKAGRALKGTEIKIASDKELLIRGSHVFMGYFENEAATREAIDEEGWLHTGDLGHIDQDGFLSIIGRKKNLIITAGGENIATEMIEQRFGDITGVEHAFVVGDRQKHLSMLFTLDAETVMTHASGLGSQATSLPALADCPVLHRFLEEEVGRINRDLARVQTIKKFRILEKNFTEETGELTPTMKVKRSFVLAKYKEEISAIYKNYAS